MHIYHRNYYLYINESNVRRQLGNYVKIKCTPVFTKTVKKLSLSLSSPRASYQVIRIPCLTSLLHLQYRVCAYSPLFIFFFSGRASRVVYLSFCIYRIHRCTCYSIEYAMRMYSEISRFFFSF